VSSLRDLFESCGRWPAPKCRAELFQPSRPGAGLSLPFVSCRPRSSVDRDRSLHRFEDRVSGPDPTNAPEANILPAIYRRRREPRTLRIDGLAFDDGDGCHPDAAEVCALDAHLGFHQFLANRRNTFISRMSSPLDGPLSRQSGGNPTFVC
jgi:hypothetical protein